MDLTPRRTFVSTDRHTTVTAETIAKNFLIGPDRAKQTSMTTTQRGTRSAILPIARRYRADRMYNLPRLNAKSATDTLYHLRTRMCGLQIQNKSKVILRLYIFYPPNVPFLFG